MTTTKLKSGDSALTDRQQRVLQWRADAWRLLSEIESMDVEPAADVVRRLAPSPEVIACVAFFYDQWKTSAKARHAASHARKPKTVDDRITDTGCKSYEELRQYEVTRGLKTGAKKGSGFITVDHSKGVINNAFTRLKKKSESR